MQAAPGHPNGTQLQRAAKLLLKLAVRSEVVYGSRKLRAATNGRLFISGVPLNLAQHWDSVEVHIVHPDFAGNSAWHGS